MSNEENTIEPDDMYRDVPVFDVDKDSFFQNMRKDWNHLEFPEDSKITKYVKSQTTRKPVYARYTDDNGEKFIKQFK